MVTIVGIGPGAREYIIPLAIDVLKESDMIIGFERALGSIDFIDKNKKCVTSISSILHEVKGYQGNVAIVASGDPCFYGISDYLKRNMDEEIRIIPGISSFQYLASKKCIPWHNAHVSSMHGRENNFIQCVQEKETSFWLTGKKNTPEMLCRELFNNEIKCKVIVGEELSYEDEKITEGSPEELMNKEFSWLSVVVVRREVK